MNNRSRPPAATIASLGALLLLPTLLTTPWVSHQLGATGESQDYLEVWLPPNDVLAQQVPADGDVALGVAVANRTREDQQVPWRSDLVEQDGRVTPLDSGVVPLTQEEQGQITVNVGLACNRRQAVRLTVADSTPLAAQVQVWIRPTRVVTDSRGEGSAGERYECTLE